MRTCKYCGKTVGEYDLYCIHCGKPLETEEKTEFKEEKQEEKRDKSPLRTAQYLVMLILFAIPVVNIIIGLIWAFRKNENENRRNLSRAWLIAAVIGTVLVFLLMIPADVAFHRINTHVATPFEYYEYYDGNDAEDFFDTEEGDWEDLERELVEHPELYEKYYEFIMENPELNIDLPEPGEYPLDPKELLPEGMGEI